MVAETLVVVAVVLLGPAAVAFGTFLSAAGVLAFEPVLPVSRDTLSH